MSLPRLYFNVRQGDTLDPVVRVNGFTIHHGRSTSQDGISGPLDHLLAPGENDLEVDVLAADPGHPGAYFHASVLHAVDESPAAQLDWPRDFPALPPPAPPFPLIQRRTFMVGEDHPRPLFASALVEDVPPEGTDETWAPVRALHAALERGEAAPIVDLFATRSAEWGRFYAGPHTSMAALREEAAANVPGPYAMAPIGRGDVVFRRCAGGRAVQLVRVGDGPAISGQCVANPKLRYRADPILVRDGGVYRIVA